MTLLRQIQDEAVSGKVGIATVLRRCRVLAARLESAPLEKWIRHESDGYPTGAKLPHYRILPMRLLGTFCGPFGSGLENGEIPISSVPKEFRERCTTYKCVESISAIEATLSHAKDGSLSVPIPPDVVRVFSHKVYRDMHCISAHGRFSQNQLVQILDNVRNKVLDFALKIEKEDADAGEGISGKSSLSPAAVTNVFNTTILGGSVGAVGNVKATTINAYNVTQGDMNSLRAALSAEGIDGTDIADLEAAIADEPTVASDGSFRPKVAAWIGKMTGKAASGAWNIAVGAAGSLLAGAIQAFYGLPG